MKAVLLRGYGGVDQLSYEDVPDATPSVGEVLVKMAATSINAIDVKIRRGDAKGYMPLKLPTVLGSDIAGTVAALGDGVTERQVGDRVLGFVNRSYAEYVVWSAAALTPIPANLDFDHGGALPVVGLTGAQLIEVGVKPTAGETVLVTGAVGSVGRSAVYVAMQHGARVIAGVRANQRGAAQALGAWKVVALDDKADVAALGELDAVADTVGRSVIEALIPHIKQNGVVASVVGAPQVGDRRDLRVVHIMSRQDPVRLERLAGDLASGKFSIPIRQRFRLSQIRQAHQLAEQPGIGKIVLNP